MHKILLVYKDTAYQAHAADYRRCLTKKTGCSRVVARLQDAHRRHLATLRMVEDALKRRGLPYRKIKRGFFRKPSGYDLVISVGGDGTFLAAARHLTTEKILGVNSDSLRSVGKFCAADAKTFPEILDRVLDGGGRVQRLQRMRLNITGKGMAWNVLNDVLVCHRHPAVMSHYILRLGSTAEEQKSSGLWIATAAGSSGAIHSAGGRRLPLDSRRFQYRPRELYAARGQSYRLTGGCFSSDRILRIASLMTSGLCCLDGANVTFPFPFGAEIVLKRSPFPLRVVSP